jgi:SAM-dependent methyltransferase
VTVRPDSKEISAVYDRIHASERREDAWHERSTRIINGFLSARVNTLKPLIINLGAGDISYPPLVKTLHVDTSIRALRHHVRSIAGDAHALPFKAACFSGAVCVGSVINYVAVADVLQELHALLRPGGTLILEYERVPSTAASPDIAARRVSYRGEPHILWTSQS